MCFIGYFQCNSWYCEHYRIIFSIGIAIRTGSIKQQLEFSHTAEEFNINRDDILLNLLSSGKNAIRNEFSNSDLLPEFQRALIEYRKKYEPLFSEQELLKSIEMIDLNQFIKSQL